MISKKLRTINIVVLFLLIVSHILGNYLILYPMKFDFRTIVSESKPLYLLVALALLALITWLISHLKIKNLSLKINFF